MSGQWKSLRCLQTMILIVLLGSLPLSACGSGTSLPVAGAWKASTGFGGVAFTANPDSTMIMDATFEFADFPCGPGSQSGSIRVSYDPGLKITNGEIAIELVNTVSSPLPPDPFNPVPPSMDAQTMTLTGEFASDGKSASGNWTSAFHGATCTQGKWDAVPGNR